MLARANLLRPLSLRKLILLGFILSVLPLMAALISAVMAVDELAMFSQATAYRVAQVSQKKEKLRESLTDLERKAKRYLVLEDEESRIAFEDAYRDLREVLDGLAGLTSDSELTAQVQRLSIDGESAFRHITAVNDAHAGAQGRRPRHTRTSPARRERQVKAQVDRADALFAQLGTELRELNRSVAGVVDVEVRNLESESRAVQGRMLGQSAVLLPASAVLIFLLTYLIIRSIRQMDRAIRKLGTGDYVRPIQVTGPKDMEYLGQRLDWLRNRLRTLEEGKQQFLRHASHEIKTPLATIHEGTGLLADEVVGELNTEQREIANILVTNTQKLDALIAELINYSQVNSRPGALQREPVDVAELVRDVVEDAQIRLRAKSVTVREAIRPVRVAGNPEQLRTLIDNLLSNAIKYSPIAGEIRITLYQAGGHMRLEFEDEGPGIDPDERKQVFEPFFQGKAAKEGGVRGTGLGLAIVSEIAAGHHGTAEALEPLPDRTGARIRVQIPLQRDD